ncbi:hypothetical protein CaCOL14_005139 [Colletotrichum acutatum]|uniref:Uncharacterized protein n=1 Tax=Glomerella acutata TaxID=27357 RepID=A0AAD8U565_GLOAC|nr:uncharacterized protein BDZ83DRAFT_758722 [Colletotrichum acutatum]KAK1704779.1 hypothetical protein BDZ83DRAFT_758722 [Colletotrichum acutatum]
MSDQQDPAPLKDPSNKESTPNAPGNQNPSFAKLASAWGPYIPPDTSYYAIEYDDPVLLENIKMLKELTAEYDQDPTDLLDVVMRVPPRLSKSMVHLVVGLLQQQKLLESVLMVTELRAEYDAGAIRDTKNGQSVKKEKKRTKTRKSANVKKDNDNAENGDFVASKGPEKKKEKSQSEDKISKSSGSAESNAAANTNHLAVPKSKRKKSKKKKKAVKATGIAKNNPELNTDKPTAPLNMKTAAKDGVRRGSETIEGNARAITTKSTVSKSKKDKAKGKIDSHYETVKNKTEASIEQEAAPKSKNKMAKTDKKDRATDTNERAEMTQPESSTGSSKTQNNKKVGTCPESDKGQEKAEVSQTTGGGLFSVFEIECMKKVQGRVERGIKDCQEVWTVIQKMEEAVAESKRAKARKMQAQEQAKCSA